MRRIKAFYPCCMLLMLACSKEQRPGAAADTTRDRADTGSMRPPSPADTQNGPSLTDTLKRPRPTGMQRWDGRLAPADQARRDSAPQVGE